MGSTTRIKLGPVSLSATTFTWPKYRGVDPQPVTIDVGMNNADELIQRLQNVSGGETTLTIIGKKKPGVNGGRADVTINGVYIERIIKVNQFRARIVLYDRRILLTQYVADANFNIQFGDGYVEGTEAKTYKDALDKLVDSIKPLKEHFGGYDKGVGDTDLPDKRVIAGLMVPGGLRALLSRANADLTVTVDGKFKFVSRSDDRPKIPSATAYGWIEQPGFLASTAFISNRPRKFTVFYNERHGMKISTPDTTAVTDELTVELEQVYASDGEFYTLEELLEAHGLAKDAIDDNNVSFKYFTQNFEGTNIERDGSRERDALIKALKDGHRTLYRLRFPDSKGHIGGWVDWAFGQITADGSVNSVAVDCPYVEFLADAPVFPGQTTYLGTEMTKNHDGPSPFIATWEQDSAAMVIRLKSRQQKNGSTLFPGALVEPLKITHLHALESHNGQEAMKVHDMIVKEPITKARLHPNFKASIYMAATRRAPNNEQMWWPAQADGFSDGDIGIQQLPPTTDLYAVRDYVDDTDPEHMPLADGLGPMLNERIIDDDSTLRAEIWKSEKTAPNNGEGVAAGLAAFKDVEVSGPISRVELMVEGGIAIRTKVITGVSQDETATRETIQKRINQQKLNTAGAPELI